MNSFVDEEALTLSGEIHLHEDVEGSSTRGEFVERRAKARINQPFPAKVWGTDIVGEAFELECAIDNLSSSGVYLRLPVTVIEGEEMSLVVKFAQGVNSGARALLRCRVVRIDSHPGMQGIGLAITGHQFL